MFRRFRQLFGQKLQKVPHFVKKHEISWFGRNWQLFQETSIFRFFHQLFGQNLQKLANLVKKHEKSLNWLKLAFFGAN